jgi:DNA-directed RNA polymerase subunit M/transcription elongation factor TFIIS
MEKILIYCSKCNAKLNIPSKLHIKFTCPSCGEKYEAKNGLILNVITGIEKNEAINPSTEPIKSRRDYSNYILISFPILIIIFFIVGNAIDKQMKENDAQVLREIKERPLKNMIDCLKKFDFNGANNYAAPETGKYIKLIEAMYVFGDSLSIRRSIETLKIDRKTGKYYLVYDTDSIKNNALPIEFVQDNNTYLVKVDKQYIWKE